MVRGSSFLIHMILLVTSCEGLYIRRIKSYLCTTMTSGRLNGLALLSVCNATSYISNNSRTHDQDRISNSYNGINIII